MGMSVCLSHLERDEQFISLHIVSRRSPHGTARPSAEADSLHRAGHLLSAHTHAHTRLFVCQQEPRHRHRHAQPCDLNEDRRPGSEGVDLPLPHCDRECCGSPPISFELRTGAVSGRLYSVALCCLLSCSILFIFGIPKATKKVAPIYLPISFESATCSPRASKKRRRKKKRGKAKKRVGQMKRNETVSTTRAQNGFERVANTIHK
ncbi:hypothetical protein MAPG_01782 [Magnaporthiopsis poae ATCC 64411]|uniref:Transmembrane protein n=1 Tax=Magnaporthiopsis poae (strain ATCC 64411 / 73-15) TaxID=644358 RepID=A0A0C4DPL3_MAGP6|nr:hypothetical protein MAPG_01782 [Magnaporthiopsis poae ATCC 64411]